MSDVVAKKNSLTKQHALHFIVTLGIVSLFADITYEGARSITGAYLAVLGANAAIVGFVAGFGELIGYGMRFFSGLLTDKTQRYWSIIGIGYLINVISVPLLALTQHWQWAVALIIAERFGKSIRIPARDAMLSRASEVVGMGWGFGLHEALDQVGAMLGPLLIAATVFFYHDYRYGFAMLALPALLALLALFTAYRQYPKPMHLEVHPTPPEIHLAYPLFKLFLIGGAFLGAAYADFALIAYHFEKTQLLTTMWIPITYGVAMGIDGIAAPVLGKLYDRFGVKVIIVTIAFTVFFAPMIFLGNAITAFLGVILWAIGLGLQESLFRSIIGQLISREKRASAYGLFNMIYGICWFLGSAALGLLYDYSMIAVVLFIFILQFISILFFIVLDKKWGNTAKNQTQ